MAEAAPELAAVTSAAIGLIRAAEGELSYVDSGMRGRALDVAADPNTPPSGVYGAGAWVVDGELVPALFVSPGLGPRVAAPLGRSEVRHLFDPEQRPAFSSLFVVALPPPSPLAAASLEGGPIAVGGRTATAGAAAEATDASLRGFLTAGHAAPQVGAIVRSRSGGAVGHVARTVRPTGTAAAASADVALIERTTRRATSSRSAQAAIGRQRDVLAIRGQRGIARTWIRGIAAEFALTTENPGWSDVAITADAVSSPGDSGAPAYIDDGQVVGHVVAGSPSDYSLVQDIGCQLRAISAVLA